MPPVPARIPSASTTRWRPSSSMKRWRSHPASENRAMCSGDTTSRPSMPMTVRGDTLASRPSASILTSESADRLFWSTTIRGPSPQNAVTTSCERLKPRSSARVVHGEPTSSSAKQKPSLDMLPWVARSTPPGAPPPTLRTTSCTARPIVALARLPCPRTLTPLFMPISAVMGPLTTRTGPTPMVVARIPCMLNSSVQTASRAASTTGRYSGRQPAITELTATFSTVHSTRFGGTRATTSSAALDVPSSIRSTRASVGGTNGSPSVQPRSYSASTSSSRAPIRMRREARPESP